MGFAFGSTHPTKDLSVHIPFFPTRPRANEPARPEAKASAVAPLIAWHALGRAAWTPRDYAALAREG